MTDPGIVKKNAAITADWQSWHGQPVWSLYKGWHGTFNMDQWLKGRSLTWMLLQDFFTACHFLWLLILAVMYCEISLSGFGKGLSKPAHLAVYRDGLGHNTEI